MLPLAARATLGLEGELNVSCLISYEGALVARGDPVGTGHCPPVSWTCKTQPDTYAVSYVSCLAVVLLKPLYC